MNGVWSTPERLPTWLIGMINPAVSMTGVVSVQGYGILTAPTASVASSTYNVVDRDGLNYQGNTSAVSGNEAFIRSGMKPLVIAGHVSLAAKFQLSTGTANRFFLGLSDQTSGYSTSANPAGKSIGLWYDSALTPQTLRFVVDDGTTQTLYDTSIGIGDPQFTDTMYLTIETFNYSPVTVEVSLYKHQYSTDLPLASNTFSTSMPTSNTLFFGAISITTTDAISKNFKFYGMQAAINGRY